MTHKFVVIGTSPTGREHLWGTHNTKAEAKAHMRHVATGWGSLEGYTFKVKAKSVPASA